MPGLTADSWKRWACGLVAASFMLAGLSGCGPQQVAHSDVEQATTLLTETFDEWKRGESLDAQRQKSPPVYVAEEIWLNGSTLQEYKINEAGEVFGTNIRFKVTLTLVDKSGTSKTREFKYLVTTTPARTIAREDR